MLSNTKQILIKKTRTSGFHLSITFKGDHLTTKLEPSIEPNGYAVVHHEARMPY